MVPSSMYRAIRKDTHTFTYLRDLGVGAAAVSRGGVHPPSAFSQLQREVGISSAGTLLSEGALLVLDAPTTFEPGVSLEAHTAAVSQRSALVQVGWPGDRHRFDMIGVLGRQQLFTAHVILSNLNMGC